YSRRGITEAPGFQPASQPQDQRGRQPPRSRCAVLLHQRTGRGGAGWERASNLGRRHILTAAFLLTAGMKLTKCSPRWLIANLDLNVNPRKSNACSGKVPLRFASLQ